MKSYALGIIALVLFAGCSSQEPTASKEVAEQPTALSAKLNTALTYLDTYTFGGNREPLEIITNSVSDAAANPAIRPLLEQKLSEILINETTTTDAKRYICRQLGRIGSPESVSALSKGLTDEAVASAAIHALKRIPGEEAAEALRTATRDLTPPHQLAAIASLGIRGETASAETLIPLLNNTDETVQRAAIQALGTLGGTQSCDALFAKWNTDPSANTNLTEACLDCAAQEVALEQPDRPIEFYNQLIALDKPSHLRNAGLTGLVKADPAQAQARLLKKLAGKDETMFMAAIGIIRNRRDHELAKPLSQILVRSTPERAIILIEALVAREERDAQPAIIGLLMSDSEALSISAANALGHLGNAQSVAPLIKIAATKTGALKQAARESLARIPGQVATNDIVQIASTGNTEYSLEAVKALKARNTKMAVRVLLNIAPTRNETLYPAIMDTLSTIASVDDIQALLNLLNEETTDSQRSAVQTTLSTILENAPDPEQASHALLEGTKIPAAHPTVLRILGERQSTTGLKAIRSGLTSTDSQLRLAAIEALSGWSTRDTLPDLETVIRDDEAGPARDAAFKGYTRILRAATDLSSAEKLTHTQLLLEASQNTSEQNQALAVLGEIRSLPALKNAQEWLSNKDSQAVAQKSLIRIAANIRGAYPEQVNTALTALINTDIPSELHEQAQATLTAIEASKGYLTALMMAGPYAEENKTGGMIYHTQFPPENPEADIQWEILRSLSTQENPWVAKLASIIGGQNKVVYLRTYVHADEPRDAILETGSNDGIKIWHNNDLVFGLNIPRALNPFEDKTPIHLTKGWNTLMFAIYQHGGNWEFCARITNPDTTPVPSLKFAPEI